MSASKEIAGLAIDNIESLLSEMFEGAHLNNAVSLGVLLAGQEEIQVQLIVTREPSEFIETDYSDWEESIKEL